MLVFAAVHRPKRAVYGGFFMAKKPLFNMACFDEKPQITQFAPKAVLPAGPLRHFHQVLPLAGGNVATLLQTKYINRAPKHLGYYY